MNDKPERTLSRRGLLAGGTALAAAAILPKVPARAQAPARWRRYNVASPQGQQMLVHYQTAIKAMLALPPTDPRNWYRLAFQHYLDCPHGNWWLFPWHRGFTGWAEQIVRRFSGFDAFAFPYWDWTASPVVPAAMNQGLLTPANPAFIQNIGAFTAAFQRPLGSTTYWQGAQLQELQARQINSNAVLWDQLTNPANANWPSFFPASGGGQNFPNVRNPNPQLDCAASKAVSAPTLAKAMASQDYATFSSPPAQQHSDVVGFALLEGQPHNNVHNNTGGVVYQQQGTQCGPNYTNTGGFMQAFLSPTDPLFYLHHSNIDRLWTAWTDKQKAAGLTYLPVPSLYAQWAKEPFLFFVNAAGQPVAQTHAGDYANIGQFNYDYQPGSVGRLPNLGAVPRRRLPVRRFPGTPPVELGGPAAGAARVRLEPDLLRLARGGSGQTLIAKVTVQLPPHARGDAYRIMVDAGDPAAAVEAGRISLFGHVMVHGPLIVTVPLDEALAILRGRNALKPNGALVFRAVGPQRNGPAHVGMAMETPVAPVPVTAVVIEAH